MKTKNNKHKQRFVTANVNNPTLRVELYANSTLRIAFLRGRRLSDPNPTPIYRSVESIIHIKFNCHNGAKCQSMLHCSQRTDSSWRGTGGILCNLANQAGSCDHRRNSKVEQSREMCTFCSWRRRDCRDSTTHPDVSSLPSGWVWYRTQSLEVETTFWDSHNDRRWRWRSRLRRRGVETWRSDRHSVSPLRFCQCRLRLDEMLPTYNIETNGG